MSSKAALLDKLPWKAGALPTFLSVLAVMGLMETARTAFLFVYLPNQGLGLDKAAAGLAVTILLTTEALSRGVGGWLVQRLGLGIVAQMAALIGLITILAVSQYPSPWLLWGLCLAWGLVISAMLPGFFTLSSRIAVQGREGRALAFTNFLPIPFVALGWVGGTFFVKNLPELSVYFLGVLLLSSALLAFALYPVREPIHTEPFRFQQLYPVLVIVPVAFAQTFAPGLLSLILVKFYSTQLGLTEWQFYLALGVAAAIAFGATGYLGRFADRRGPRIPLIVGLSIMAVVFYGVALMPSYPVFVALAALGGVGFAIVTPSWSALLVRVMPEQNRAAIWGSLMVVEGLGTSLSPAVGGLLWDRFGPSAPLEAAALIFLALAVFYALVFGRLKLKQFSSR